jgi:hypothetical protein
MAGSLLGDIEISFPKVLAGVGTFAQWFVIFILVAGAVGVITYYLANKKQYNKKIHIFEEVSGMAMPIGEDLAREIVLPNTSIKAFLLKKRKLYLPRPSIQTGKDSYWFFIRPDGEWMNVRPENLNTKLRQLNLHYDHADMRITNAALKKLVEKNYKKTNWLKEYAPYIAIGILVLILGLVFFILLNKASGVASTLNAAISSNTAVVDRLDTILTTIDNICSSSGVRKV